MKVILGLSFVLAMGWGTGAYAACPSDNTIYANASVQRDAFTDGSCFVSVVSMLSTNLKYRSYLITDEGLLMVFNSFGQGPEEKATGARNFFFFPRGKTLEVNFDESSNVLKVKQGNGDFVSFSGETAEIVGVGLGSIQVDEKIQPNNRGGVEFPSYSGLMMDGGFSIGHSPSAEKNSKSTFRDANGMTCEVTNNEVFRYTSGGNVLFKFSDSELSIFLKLRCPTLNVGF